MSNLCVTVTHVIATTSNSPSSESWQEEFILQTHDKRKPGWRKDLISFVE